MATTIEQVQQAFADNFPIKSTVVMFNDTANPWDSAKTVEMSFRTIAVHETSQQKWILYVNSLSTDQNNWSSLTSSAAGDLTASDISYDASTSGLAAANVQDALDEIDSRIDTIETSPTQAGSGLTLTNDVMDLGGAVTQNTQLAITDLPAVSYRVDSINTISNESTSIVLEDNNTSLSYTNNTTFTSHIVGVDDIGVSIGIGSIAGSIYMQFIESTGLIQISDSINTEGMRYDIAGYTSTSDEWLPHKKYVDDSILTNGTVNAINGLSKVANAGGPDDVKLGGTLTEITSINTDTFNFDITSTTGDISVGTTTTGLTVLGAGATSLTSSTILTLDDGVSQLVFNPGTGNTFTDGNTNGAGLEYAADYSIDYSARSLVDKAYVDAIAQGLSAKAPVRVVADVNVPQQATGGVATIDGVAVAVGDRVLLTAQTAAADNGIYEVSAAAWPRTLDADEDGEIRGGTYVFVDDDNATNYANTGWVQTNDGPIAIDVNDQLWILFNRNGVLVAGNGIDITTNTVSVDIGTDAGLKIDGSAKLAIDLQVPTTSGLKTDANGLSLQLNDYNALTDVHIQTTNNDLQLADTAGTNKAAIGISGPNDSLGLGYTDAVGIVNVDTNLSSEIGIDRLTGNIGVARDDTAANTRKVMSMQLGEMLLGIQDITTIATPVDIATLRTTTAGTVAIKSTSTFDLDFGGAATITDSRTVGSQAGLEYAVDYSADYSLRSLVDKDYVDTAINTGATINAINGLTKVTNVGGPDDVKLGGTFIENTTLDAATFTFDITNHGGITFADTNGSGTTFSGTGAINFSNTGGTIFTDSSAGGWTYNGAAGTGSFNINANATGGFQLTTTGTHTLQSNSTDGFKLTDLRTAGSQTGMEYAADYSADYSLRSLVDKDYVDTTVTNAASVNAQNGLTQVANANGPDIVKLGGALTENTSINGGTTFSFDIVNASSSSISTTGGLSLTGGTTLNLTASAANNGMTLTSGTAVFELTNGATTFTDGAGAVGISYAADYAANNTLNDRWLTDKKYVDDAINTGATINAINGLTKVTNAGGPDDVKLGGTLTELTLIDANNQTFTLNNLLSTSIITTNGTGLLTSSTQNKLQIATTSEFIVNENGGTGIGDLVIRGSAMINPYYGFNELRTVGSKKGAQYVGFGETDVNTAGSVSYADLQFNSLVPKKYVDDSITAGQFVLTNGTGTTVGGDTTSIDVNVGGIGVNATAIDLDIAGNNVVLDSEKVVNALADVGGINGTNLNIKNGGGQLAVDSEDVVNALADVGGINGTNLNIKNGGGQLAVDSEDVVNALAAAGGINGTAINIKNGGGQLAIDSDDISSTITPILAGAGLINNGSSLDVGQGLGITVNADDIDVKVAGVGVVTPIELGIDGLGNVSLDKSVTVTALTSSIETATILLSNDSTNLGVAHTDLVTDLTASIENATVLLSTDGTNLGVAHTDLVTDLTASIETATILLSNNGTNIGVAHTELVTDLTASVENATVLLSTDGTNLGVAHTELVTDLSAASTPSADILLKDDGSGNLAVVSSEIATAISAQTDNLTQGSVWLGDGANKSSELDMSASGSIMVGNATTATAVLVNGDATMDSLGALTIANDAITTAKIIDGAVTNAKLDKTNIPLSGFGAAAADLDIGSNNITNMADGLVASDAVNKGQLDAVSAGLNAKASCRFIAADPIGSANFNNLTLVAAGLDVVDGTAVLPGDINDGDRILLVSEGGSFQDSHVDNGIYFWDATNTLLTRALDFDGDPIGEVASGDFTYVALGDNGGNAQWVLVEPNGDAIIGTDALKFTPLAGPSNVNAGAGLIKIANILDVDLNPTGGLEFDLPAGTNGIPNNDARVQIQLDTIGGVGLASAIRTSANGTAIAVDDTTIEAGVSGELQVKDLGITNSKLALTSVNDTTLDLGNGVNQINSNTFSLTASYAAAAGVVVGGDTTEAAIQKLDGNIADLTTNAAETGSGITVGVTGIVDWTGALTADSVITGNNTNSVQLGSTGATNADRLSAFEVHTGAVSSGVDLSLSNTGDYTLASAGAFSNTFTSTYAVKKGAATHLDLGTVTKLTGVGTSSLDLDNTNINIFTDGNTTKTGLQYGADYSATYVTRSLVDKEYVDSNINANISIFEVDTFNPFIDVASTSGNDTIIKISAGVNYEFAYDPSGEVAFSINGATELRGSGWWVVDPDNAFAVVPEGSEQAGHAIKWNNNLYLLESDDVVDVRYVRGVNAGTAGF